MKTLRFYFIAALLFTLSFLFYAGCAPEGERFGDVPYGNTKKTSIGAILSSSQDYIDKEVTIEGNISSESSTGEWIEITDMAGLTIYVEIHGTPFEPIPQRVGKKVLVKGVVYQTEGEVKETKIRAKGLVIK